MAINTNAGIKNGYYGRWKYDKNTNASKFDPLGKAVFVDRVTSNIENGDTTLGLSFDFMGEKKYITVPHEETADNTLIQTLAKKGADVTKKHFDVLVDTLRKQKEDMETNGIGAEKVYTHLGWIRIPVYNDVGERCGAELHYRAYKLLGGCSAKYEGPYSVTPTGSFNAWCDMVRNEVVGNSVLELVLIAGLAAVVNGLIAPLTTGENPILHLCAGSSQGKTTGLDLATSVSGEPYDGERRVLDKHGEIVIRKSIYGSWGATENATTAQCAGNKGAVIVLNELGKFVGKDMSRIIYDLSEGTDKSRLDTNMKTYTTECYYTSIISAGEISLLSRCKEKLEGKEIRVMELNQALTKDAAHSRRIKDACRKNNGWAAPVLAQYILDNGGASFVLPIYEKFRTSLAYSMPDSPSKERFVEKFAALFMATAEIASKALNINFDVMGLYDFFVAYESEKGKERNVSANSYEVLIEECRINKHCFYMDDGPVPIGKSYGRVERVDYTLPDGRAVIEEFLVRRDFVEKVLVDKGFPNIKTCVKAWKASGVLDYEDDTHPTRARKIDKTSKAERVFVFRVFDDSIPSWVAECESYPEEPLEVIIDGSKPS